MLQIADLPTDVRLARAVRHGHLAEAAKLGGVNEQFHTGRTARMASHRSHGQSTLILHPAHRAPSATVLLLHASFSN